MSIEQPKMEQKENTQPISVEEAVREFVLGDIEGSEDRAIAYLRVRPDDITEFCLQTFESYKNGDKTGVVRLGMIIKKLL